MRNINGREPHFFVEGCRCEDVARADDRAVRHFMACEQPMLDLLGACLESQLARILPSGRLLPQKDLGFDGALPTVID